MGHNVHNAHYQENGIQIQINVFAKHQQLTGMETTVFAQLEHMDLNVFHAQHQEHGISVQTNVFVHHQPMFGTETLASAQLIHLDHNVLHVQHQDSGIITLANVFVQKRESGTAKTAFVNQDFTELIASAVHLKNIGMKQLKLAFAKPH